MRNADCNLPNAGRSNAFHAIGLDIPEVEGANDADKLSIRRPDREPVNRFAKLADAFVTTQL